MDSDWKTLSKQSYNFVKSCLTVDIKLRMTPDEGLAHKWILQKDVSDTIISDR